MPGLLGDELTVEARLARRTSNALHLVFRTGPDDPIATASQGAGDGKGAKLGTLLGFKNGGPGKHGLVVGDRHLVVHTANTSPSTVLDGDVELGRLERDADSSRVLAADGRVLVQITSDPHDAKTLDAFTMLLHDGAGAPLGRLLIARTQAAWSLLREIESEIIWWGKAAPLKLPLLGAGINLDHTVDDDTVIMLLAVCVDICIGLRPYIPEMR
jgi:hypothetical protein